MRIFVLISKSVLIHNFTFGVTIQFCEYTLDISSITYIKFILR